LCDFLFSLNKNLSGKDLLTLIKKPYNIHAPEGQCFDYKWGSLAVLEDHLASNKNIIKNEATIFAWIGDIVTDMSDRFTKLFSERLTSLQGEQDDKCTSLQTDELFGKLNGAFAIISADAGGFCIVTDPLNFTMVYVGKNTRGEILSFGTHPDLVASVSDERLHIDMISVGEFLSSGTPIFPNTMYENVKELNPGRFYYVTFKDGRAQVKELVYWSPPEELRRCYDDNKLAKELQDILLSVVRDRCIGLKKVGVLLSGGLDSRLVMAAVPETVDCIGLTFCNQLNRETRIAKRVAECYNREWFPLFREKDFLGKYLIDTTKLVGCEFDWVHAHSVGFVEEIAKFNLDAVLGGVQFDVYLKAYFADDWFCKKRMRGLLTDRYMRKSYSYADNTKIFWRQNLRKNIIEQMNLRRKRNYEENIDLGRGSIAEWLTSYVFSQDGTVAFWPVERRKLPTRLVAMDRRLLDFSFKCPIELKLGGKIFDKAAKNIYGAGARIPNANNGVRPSSRHWSRLVQRAIRKVQNRTTIVRQKFGKKAQIQHSWHDYQKYWQESGVLSQLIQDYGKNLEEFDGQVFANYGQELLKCRNIYWCDGFRLLQLAVWRNIIDSYKLEIKSVGQQR